MQSEQPACRAIRQCFKDRSPLKSAEDAAKVVDTLLHRRPRVRPLLLTESVHYSIVGAQRIPLGGCSVLALSLSVLVLSHPSIPSDCLLSTVISQVNSATSTSQVKCMEASNTFARLYLP